MNRRSSCHAHLRLAPSDGLDHDPCYLALAKEGEHRQARYRHFLQSAIPAGEWNLIREAVPRGQPTGSSRFVDQVEDILGKRIEKRSPGRPKKTEVLPYELGIK